MSHAPALDCRPLTGEPRKDLLPMGHSASFLVVKHGRTGAGRSCLFLGQRKSVIQPSGLCL